MKNRFVVAALTALALVALVVLPALAAKPSTSNQLRTTRIISKQGVSPTFTLNADSLSGPRAQGVLYEGTAKKLMVIDWISFTSTAGAVAEDFSVYIQDDSGLYPFVATQTVLANTTETMFFQFPTGLPMFNMRNAVGGSAFQKTKDDPMASTAVIGTSATLTGTLCVGYHMEVTDDRTP